MDDGGDGDNELRSLVGQLAWDGPSLSMAPPTQVDYSEEGGIHLAVKVTPGQLPVPPPGADLTITFGGVTLTAKDLTVTALFDPAGGTSFTLRPELTDGRLQSTAISGSLGGLSHFDIPATITAPVTTTPPTVAIVVSFDGNALYFEPGLDADTAVKTNRQLHVGQSGQAIAFGLLLQDRPDTPVPWPVSPPSLALLPPFSAGPGSDGALQLETAFVMELIASMGLRPMIGAATPLAVNRGGVVLTSLAATYRRVDAESLAATGESIDLDSGARAAFAGGASVPGFGDLSWSVTAGLTAGRGARLIRINRDFSSVSVTDVADAMAVSSSIALSPAGIPVVPSSARGVTLLPLPAVVGVRTSTGRFGKCALWQSASGTVVFRYLIWDTRAAACRILPVATHWAPAGYARDPDTPGPGNTSVKHERFAHTATFDAQATRVMLPLQLTWRLGTTALAAGAGAATVDGVTVNYRLQDSTLQLDAGLGDSLQAVPLSIEVTDADGRYVTDTRPLSIAGTRDTPYDPRLEWLAGALGRNAAIVGDAATRHRQSQLREKADLTLAPEPAPDFLDRIQGPQEAWHQRLVQGGYTGSPDDVPIR
jgi:hypothetical protein